MVNNGKILYYIIMQWYIYVIQVNQFFRLLCGGRLVICLQYIKCSRAIYLQMDGTLYGILFLVYSGFISDGLLFCFLRIN